MVGRGFRASSLQVLDAGTRCIHVAGWTMGSIELAHLPIQETGFSKMSHVDPSEEGLRQRSLRLSQLANGSTAAALLVWLTGVGLTLALRLWWTWPVTLLLALSFFFIGDRIRRRANAARSEIVARSARRDLRPPLLVLRSFSQPVLTEER